MVADEGRQSVNIRVGISELIIIGEEIQTTEGELLAAFVEREIPAGLEPGAAIKMLKDQNAFISVSHPFDTMRSGWKPDTLAA